MTPFVGKPRSGPATAPATAPAPIWPTVADTAAKPERSPIADVAPFRPCPSVAAAEQQHTVATCAADLAPNAPPGCCSSAWHRGRVDGAQSVRQRRGIGDLRRGQDLSSGCRLGGISRQRVYQITSRADFPIPAADLVQGKLWHVGDVEAWITAKGPQLSDVE